MSDRSVRADRPRARPVSLRNRISLVLVSVVAIALIGANVAVFAFASHGLDQRFDDQLSALSGFAQGISVAVAAGAPPLPGVSDAEVDANFAGLAAQGGGYVGLIRPDGTVALSTFLLSHVGGKTPPVVPADLRPQVGQPVVFDTTATFDGEVVPFRARATAQANGTTIIAALPTAALVGDRRTLILLESLATLAVLVLLAVLTRWLVGFSLQPLEQMQGAADRIAEGDLSHRVDPSGPETEISRLGASLNAMLAEIEQAFSAKDESERALRLSEATLRQFVTDASHELRTPLTSIRGYAQLLARGRLADADERTRAAGRIEQEAERLAGLVDNLLVLARLDEGVALRREVVDLNALVGQVVDDARIVGPDRVIGFEADPVVTCIGDPDALARVLTNLVANAAQHTPPSAPIEVELRRVDDRPATVRMEVIDHGDGVPADVAPFVFDRFYRADESRSRDRGGSGLGLAIVAGLVAALGGGYELRETPGGGATFRVELPLVASAAEAADCRS